MNNENIKTIIGGLMSIKILETGMKIIDKQKKKIKGDLIYGKEKKTKKIQNRW